MVFNGLSPFPSVMTPITNISPLTYRDASTFLEYLETIKQWLNETLVPETDTMLEKMFTEFQTAIANSENTVTTAKNEWIERFDLFIQEVVAEIALLNAEAIKLSAVGHNELTIDVKHFGAKGDGVTDDTVAIQAASDMAAALGASLLYSAGTYKISGTNFLIPGKDNTRRKVVMDGDVVQYANFPAFQATGTWGLSKAMSGDLVPRGRTLTVDNNAWFVPGETIFLTSNDTVPGAPDKLGCLRKVISLTGSTTVNIDVPYYRTMLVASSLRAFKVSMHPGISITGSGNLRSGPLLENNTHLIYCSLVNDPVVNLNIGPSGGPGVLFAHCDGFEGGGHIHDLRDQDTPDANGLVHFGYGWNVAGASRNGFITGTAYKCRHAFTTNTAETADGFGGEPENIFTDIVTSRCSNKAIDSHRAGWGLTHIVNDSGSYGALQVRADNVHATVYSSETYDSAVNVSSLVTVPPTLERVEVHGSGGTLQLGVYLLGPAIIGDIITRGCLTAVEMVCSGARINSVDHYGKGPATGGGLTIEGSNNTIGDVILENCGTGIYEKPGSTGNIFHGVRRFTNVGTVLNLQAYSHIMALRAGEYVANTAAPGTVKGRIPVVDNAGNAYGQIIIYNS